MFNSIGGAHRQVPSRTRISVRDIRIAAFVALAAAVTMEAKVAAHQIGPATQDTQAGKDDSLERVTDLIDQFTVVSNLEISYHNYIPRPMDPSGEYIRSLGQIPRRVEPGDCNEIIHELVSLGAAAVPLLVQHLDDDRETNIILRQSNYDRLVDRYDYNPNGEFKPAQEAARGAWTEQALPDGHRLKVGDLCFSALGQIVNRLFYAAVVSIGPGIEVTSPLLSPTILEAARAEWADLTVEQHKASLRFDALHPYNSGSARVGAMRRLVFYYPKVAEEVTLQLLERPMYDVILTYQFAWNELAKMDDPTQWRKSADAFFEKYGQQYRRALYQQLVTDQQVSTRRYLVDPLAIRDALFPKGPEFTTAVQQADQARFILSVYDLDSKPVDDRVLELLRTLDKEASADIMPDYFAIACIYKLMGRGHDEELRAYCRERIPKASDWYAAQLTFLLDRVEAEP